LEGQFPESKVKGEPADFSPMTEYAWYEWVKFRETSVDFPDSKIQLIRDLGTVIDIGPATAHTVLNVKGKIMYHTPIRSLTSDEIQSSSETRAWLAFGEDVVKKLESSIIKDDFKDDP
jgi:hypothetical protein